MTQLLERPRVTAPRAIVVDPPAEGYVPRHLREPAPPGDDDTPPSALPLIRQLPVPPRVWRYPAVRGVAGALVRRRRRRRALRVLLAFTLATLSSGLSAGAVLDGWLPRLAPPEPREAVALAAPPPVLDPEGQRTLLLVRADAPGAAAAGITLLAAGPGVDQASALFLPVGTLVEIPGVGLDRLGLAHAYGGRDLVAQSVASLLGVQVDHVATISTPDLGAVLQAAGGLEVAVPERLVVYAPDGTASVAFEAGPQYLDGQRLAGYWGFTTRDESELDAFTRQQQVLAGVLPLLADPALRASVVDTAARRLGTNAEPAWLDALLARLSTASAADGLTSHLLPVEPFGAADPVLGASWRLREEAAAALVAEVLAASAPDAAADAVTLQVLNGVGRPGVAQEVDRALAGGGFRIVRSENARTFAEPTTRILLYGDYPGIHEAAERVRSLLGVGTILRSRQPQSVVDLTIVVGADFGPPAAP